MQAPASCVAVVLTITGTNGDRRIHGVEICELRSAAIQIVIVAQADSDQNAPSSTAAQHLGVVYSGFRDFSPGGLGRRCESALAVAPTDRLGRSATDLLRMALSAKNKIHLC